MTLIAAPIPVEDVDAAVAVAAGATERGADLVEWRIDAVPTVEAVRELLDRSPLPGIVTCRPGWEGGRYTGTDAHRLELFRAACEAPRPPVYVDVELRAFAGDAGFRQAVTGMTRGEAPRADAAGRPGLILSSHDFEGRPVDLLARFTAMVDEPACAVAKLAWTARSLRDNLEAFELLSQRAKPTIALCMGEAGLASRVLAKKFGALLTFATADAETATAPGQPTVDELKRLYRWDAQGPGTRVYGVVGWPVGHSMSPPLHNAGFDAAGVDAVYLPMPVAPAWEPLKATLLAWLDAQGLHFRGASVTIPHKAHLLRLVRGEGGEIEPLAERIGAANTLVVRDSSAGGALTASNTDYAAALDSVCAAMGVKRDGLAGKRVAVAGAGGAARAVVAGFAEAGAAVTVYNRTVEKAEALAAEFGGEAAGIDALADAECEVLINCTSLGMHPRVEGSPLPDDAAVLEPGVVVFDTVYNPIRTRLLQQAEAAGAKTVPGTEMFVRQGAAQFERWTGKPAPLDVFRAVVRERLDSR